MTGPISLSGNCRAHEYLHHVALMGYGVSSAICLWGLSGCCGDGLPITHSNTHNKCHCSFIPSTSLLREICYCIYFMNFVLSSNSLLFIYPTAQISSLFSHASQTALFTLSISTSSLSFVFFQYFFLHRTDVIEGKNIIMWKPHSCRRTKKIWFYRYIFNYLPSFHILLYLCSFTVMVRFTLLQLLYNGCHWRSMY